ncbi:hypothetical protein [Hymenobacter glacialis]|nr:hypothetical protein [Hymenobacter glacialis]
MVFSKTVIGLLVLFCLGWSNLSYAQQGPPLVPLATSSPLLTAADTVAVLQELFRAKRKSSALFLAASPVAIGLTGAGMAVAALGQSGSSPSTVPILLVLGGGATATVALLQRYLRYTKASERDLLSDYQRTHQLPGWAKRNLAEYRAEKP